jgi:hypothetical protein
MLSGCSGAALFEADLDEGVFHRLAGDPDDSPERRIQLLRHFNCPRDRERAEEQSQDCCRVTRREQAEAQKEEAQPERHHQQRNRDANRVLLLKDLLFTTEKQRKKHGQAERRGPCATCASWRRG